MTKYAVVKTGGKQYLVKEGQEVVVDRINIKPASAKASAGKGKIELEALLKFSDDNKEFDLGSPILKTAVSAEIVDHVKGDKIRVARFKAKVRYRKVKGFRPQLTTLKIIKI